MSSNLSQIAYSELLGLTLFLVLVALIGSIGNALVLLVYCKRRDGQTATFFIIVLAVVDLQICLLVVPFTLVMEWLNYNIYFDFLCKSYYILMITNTTFSSLLISAVALDRYLCICHPLRRILPVYRAKILVLSLAALAFILSILAALNVKVIEYKPDKPPGSSSPFINVTILSSDWTNHSHPHTLEYICEEIGYMNQTTSGEAMFYQILKKTNHICFIGCILIVLVFYSLIFRVVLRIRRDTKFLLIKPPQPPPPPPSQSNLRNSRYNHSKGLTIDNPSAREMAIRSQYQDHSQVDDVLYDDIELSQSKGNQQRPAGFFSGLKDSELFQNFRSAAMLFVVAIVYIVVFSPGLLMANEYIPLNIIAFNVYYLNNACNPIIYCFMNSEFRKQLKKLIWRKSNNDYKSSFRMKNGTTL